MAFEFDPEKSVENVRIGRLPFDFAGLLFEGPFIEEPDLRIDYGETRFIATGPIEDLGGRIFVVVYTWRGHIRRIVSFRKANDREIEKYRAALA